MPAQINGVPLDVLRKEVEKGYKPSTATLLDMIDALVRAEQVRDPQRWDLDAKTAGFLAEMIVASGEPAAITLRVGYVREDDDTVKHGLLVEESDCPEEGASLLVEMRNLEQQGVGAKPKN